MSTNRVLVTDGLPRSSLAVVRSLGRKGLRVYASEKTRFAPTLFSKYCSHRMVYPDPKKSPDDFYQWLIASIQNNRFEVCIPVDDSTLEIVMNHKDELEKLSKFLLPPLDGYRIATDKGLSVKAAQQAGLLCPETWHPHSMEEVEALIPNLEIPVVIKPRKSSGSRGIKFVDNKSDFVNIYRQVHSKYPFPIIQKYLPPARKYSVCLLFDKRSHLKASFVQREVRHYPVDIGSSVVQESVYYPELIEQSLSLMRYLNWTGIVELDFLQDHQGQAYFMEINPRFWASLQMAIFAGVDFPWLLYRLAKGEDVEEVHTYKTGIMCRWLLPGDILHFLTNKKRFEMNPPFLAGKKRNVFDDIISKEDPFPTIGFILACFRYLFDLEMWKFVLKGDFLEKRAHN